MTNLPIPRLQMPSHRSHLLRMLQCSHRNIRQKMIRIRPTLMEKMSRDRRTRKQMIRSRISTRPGSRRKTLHTFQIKPVLLKMTRDILASQPVYTHELHYRFRYGVLYP
ncbi:hypothetical protein HanRHA438_Chr01g0010971 [Helianthus annuus]|nr:hypothetical protein HanRHA438_Chr01g0010971 [Helianthus annuus]